MKKTKSVYIHIPFCQTICTYCDFCKYYYNEIMVDKYLTALFNEIKSNYNGEKIDTIYIGGGTPSSLNIGQLKRLLEITKVFKGNIKEFTVECNIENIDEDKVRLFKQFNVNRISIGVQTFNIKHLNFLNRKHHQSEVKNKITMIKKYINNINVDLIYALPGETLEELNDDINIFLSLDIPHISTYSLIIEDNTILKNNKVNNVDEDLDFEMYNLIINKLKNNGYIHYEISNFCRKGYESKHNLTYWNNNYYYGFGLGASGYIDNMRYTNTRSINHYIQGNCVYEKEVLNKNIILENAFILGLRKIDGINVIDFKRKYNVSINKIDIVKELLDSNKLVLSNNQLYINEKYLYVSNDILVDFIGVDYEKYI